MVKALWLFLIVFFLTACQPYLDRFSPESDTGENLFIPPTLNIPTLSPTAPVLIQEEELRPTPTPSCDDNLTFLNDITIPDGTAVNPDKILDKRWQVQNTGTCNWDDRYRLRLIAGLDLGAVPEQALFPARGGTLLVIRMLFTSPGEPGSYRSAWQAHSPAGEPFGDPFFIDIVVRP